MARLIVWNVISLDGFFEGTDKWDLAFHEHVWGPDLEELSIGFGEEMGLLVFGRVTYEGMAAYWSNQPDDTPEVTSYMNSVSKLVASRTVDEASWSNTEVTDDIVGELTRRKAELDRPIYVFGSAELTDSLLDAGLVDELMVAVSPVVLGAGNPLFKPRAEPRMLQLEESRSLDSGGVLLRYLVADGS